MEDKLGRTILLGRDSDVREVVDIGGELSEKMAPIDELSQILKHLQGVHIEHTGCYYEPARETTSKLAEMHEDGARNLLQVKLWLAFNVKFRDGQDSVKIEGDNFSVIVPSNPERLTDMTFERRPRRGDA
jgi:hypothetical protein